MPLQGRNFSLDPLSLRTDLTPLLLILLVIISLTLHISLAYGEDKKEEEQPTPLAGEEFHTKVLGEPVKVPLRDRKNVTAASFGVQYLHDGPTFYQVLPFGALYVWRNSDDLKQRFRGTFPGL